MRKSYIHDIKTHIINHRKKPIADRKFASHAQKSHVKLQCPAVEKNPIYTRWGKKRTHMS